MLYSSFWSCMKIAGISECGIDKNLRLNSPIEVIL